MASFPTIKPLLSENPGLALQPSGVFSGSKSNPAVATLPRQVAQAEARFGGSASVSLDKTTEAAHKLYQLMAGDPGRRIIMMDLIGWCALRTFIDYYREAFYLKNLRSLFSNQPKNKESQVHGNPAAASERVLREIMATLGDVAIAGPLVAHLTSLTDKTQKLYTGNFIDQGLMAYCQDKAVQLLHEQDKAPMAPEELLHKLYGAIARDVSKGQPAPVQQHIYQLLTPAKLNNYATPLTAWYQRLYAGLFGGTGKRLDVDGLAQELVTALKQPGDHTVELAGLGRVQLSDLLTNLHKLQEKAKQYGPISLEDFAHQLKTSRNIRQKLPLVLAGVFILNLMVPRLIQKNTVRTFGITQFPGEMNLMRHKEAPDTRSPDEKAWYEHVMPYLARTVQKGNMLPALEATLFLPFVLGMYRIGKRPLPLDIPKGMNLDALKAYGRQWLEKHDFAKSFPWSSDQQQATTYATTLFSRIITSRSVLEFQERLLDSILSYMAAFELTPALESRVAKLIGQAKGIGKGFQKWVNIAPPQLFKPDGQMRTESEIRSLVDPKAQRDTLTAKIWLDWMMFVGTTAAMGVFEPILCILLTSLRAEQLNNTYDRHMTAKTESRYGNNHRLQADLDSQAAFHTFLDAAAGGA